MNNNRILFITFNPVWQATWLRAYFLAKELVKQGHSVTLLGSSIGSQAMVYEQVEGVNLVSMPKPWNRYFAGWDPVELYQRMKWVRQKKFDIVHSFETRPTNLYPSLLAQGFGAIWFTDWADWFGKGGAVEERTNTLFRFFYRGFETHYENRYRLRAEGTTVICELLREKAIGLGVHPQNLLYLPNAVNNPRINKIDTKNARDQLGLLEKTFIIGLVGANFRSDHDLIRNTCRLFEKYPNVKFLHIGRSMPMAEKPENLYFTGEVDQGTLNLYISACSVCWLPLAQVPANEGRLPLRLSDYFSAGKTIITTDVGEAALLVKKANAGITCAASPEAFEIALLPLINNYRQLDTFGNNALAFARLPENSWQARALDLQDFYMKRISK